VHFPTSPRCHFYQRKALFYQAIAISKPNQAYSSNNRTLLYAIGMPIGGGSKVMGPNRLFQFAGQNPIEKWYQNGACRPVFGSQIGEIWIWLQFNKAEHSRVNW